jgi:tetratricopeptide (TPR) repeat protein
VDKNDLGNLILFPNLPDRYVDLAFEARGRNDYQQAKDHLEQALAIDPDHPVALHHILVTYQDLHMFRDAQYAAEKILLKHGIRDIEIVRLLVISLLQLEEYEQIEELLSLVLKDGNLPLDVAKEFHEILDVCNLFIYSAKQQNENGLTLMERKVKERREEDPNYMDHLLQALLHGNYDQQLHAIEQLKYIDDAQVVSSFKKYLTMQEIHPVLKTLCLRVLKEMGADGTVLVYKFGKGIELDVDNVPMDDKGFHPLQQRLIELIADRTCHDDPAFETFASHIWVEYLATVYPFIPDLRPIEAWAAAIHYETSLFLSLSLTQKQIASQYGVTTAVMLRRYEKVDGVMKMGQGRSPDLLK